MSTQKRFVLEGTWSGYVSSQTRVVHRTVVSEKVAASLDGIHGIQFTDGTMLYLSVRQAMPRERVEIKNSYGSLIDECRWKNHWSVAGLREAPWPAKNTSALEPAKPVEFVHLGIGGAR